MIDKSGDSPIIFSSRAISSANFKRPDSHLNTQRKFLISPQTNKDFGSPLISPKTMQSPGTAKSSSVYTGRNSSVRNVDELIPALEKKQQFIDREKTFHIFLKKKDLEVMLGIKNSPTGLAAASPISQSPELSWLLHSKLKKDLDYKLKSKKGKMYLNELWSKDYYSTVVSTSKMTKGLENGLLMSPKLEANHQEHEDEVRIDGEDINEEGINIRRSSHRYSSSLTDSTSFIEKSNQSNKNLTMMNQQFTDKQVTSPSMRTPDLTALYMQSDKQFFKSILRDMTIKTSSVIKRDSLPHILLEGSPQERNSVKSSFWSPSHSSARPLNTAVSVTSPLTANIQRLERDYDENEKRGSVIATLSETNSILPTYGTYTI